MDNYKQVNSELIAKVQEMRIVAGSYQKEIIKLRADLMAEHQIRVELERKITNLAERQFRDLMQEVAPGASILQLFDESSAVRGSDEAAATLSSERSSSSRAEILQELRRSTSLQRRYSGVVTASPTRSSFGRNSHSNEKTPPAELAQAVAEEDEERTDEEETLSAYSQLDEIHEEEEPSSNDEKTLEQSVENELPTTAKTLGLRVGKSRDDHLSKTSQPLRDVTNTPERISPKIMMQRGKERKNRHKETQEKQPERPEESISEARCAPIPEVQITLPTGNKHLEHSRRENASSSGSPSFAISDLSIGNFADAFSSTPCNPKSDSNSNENHPRRRSSMRRCTQMNAQSQHDSSSLACTNSATSTALSASNSSRPRRHCAPTNLTEPKLQTKMRNESKERKKPKVKKT